MAHSYTQLPVSIPLLFEDIVSKVRLALLGELGSGREVQFLHGTYNHIRQRIEAKDKAEGNKQLKYPLIALIHSFEEQVVSDSKKVDVSLNFLICTETTNQKYSEDRYKDNYEPILYPIYAEFLEQCKRSGYFAQYGDFEHTKVDDLHMGEETGNGAYTLPDVVDGLWIKDLKLKVIPNKCTLLSSVNKPAELVFMSIIEDVDVTYTDDVLSLSFLGTLIDTDSVLASMYYYLHKGDATPAIDVTAINGMGTASFSVASMADGEYSGYIEAQDGGIIVLPPIGNVISNARTHFWYKVEGGKVVSAMSNHISYDNLQLSVNAEGFDVNSSLNASDYVITAFDYTDISGDSLYQHSVNGSLSELTDVRYEFNTGRSNLYKVFKQKVRVSNRTLNSQITFKIK